MTVSEYRQRFKGENKFSARATVEDGMRFDSKLERDRYLYWRKLRKAGAVLWFTRQVPFWLPGNIIWRADFLIAQQWAGDSRWAGNDPIRVEDCKGVMTRVSINKIKQVEALYGIKVHIVKRENMR